MDFRILGPIAVRSDGGFSSVSSHRQRKILATMLVDLNRPVSTQRLIRVLWGERPPSTAVQQVQNCAGALRKLLAGLKVGAELKRISSSYSLALSSEQLDAEQFGRMCTDMELRVRKGDLEGASDSARRALGLWSGEEALEDVGSDELAPAVARFEEMRVRVIEKYGEIEISRGNHAAVVVQFSEWVGRYPYHESLHSYLALALYHTGRTAESLQVLEGLRARLRTDLGIEAGVLVEKVHRRLLDWGGVSVKHREDVTAEGYVLQLMRSALDQLATAIELLSPAGLPGDGGRMPPEATTPRCPPWRAVNESSIW